MIKIVNCRGADVQPAYRVIQLSGAKCTSNGIEEMKDAPGGGHIASILDPEGFPVNFIYGQTPAQPQDMPEKLLFNDESTKPRARKFQRFEPGPAAVHKVCAALCQIAFPNAVPELRRLTGPLP